jgi:hypothetical protein
MKSSFENEMKAIVTKMYEVEQNSIPQNEELKKRYMLSDIFHQKMKRMIIKVERRQKIRSAVKYTVATAAMIVFLCLVTQPQIVTRASEEIIMKLEHSINIWFRRDVNIEELPVFELGYVPEGYVLQNSYHNRNNVLTTYRNGKETFIFSYYSANSVSSIDDEDRIYRIITLNDGTEIHYFKSEIATKSSSMMWLSQDDNVVFGIHGPFTEHEFLKIQKNIREKN